MLQCYKKSHIHFYFFLYLNYNYTMCVRVIYNTVTYIIENQLVKC